MDPQNLTGATQRKRAPRKMPFARGLGEQVMSALNAATPFVLKGGKTALRKAFAAYIRTAVLKGGSGAINRTELGRIDLKKAAGDFIKSAGKEFVREFLKPQKPAARGTIEDVPSRPAKRDPSGMLEDVMRDEPEDEPGTVAMRGQPTAEADVSAGPSMTPGQAVLLEAEKAMEMATGRASRVRPTKLGIQNRLDAILRRVRAAVPEARIVAGSAARRDLEGLVEDIMRAEPEQADLPSRVDRLLTGVRDAAASVLRPGTAARRDLDGLFEDITRVEPEEAAPARRTPQVRLTPGTAARRDTTGMMEEVMRAEPEPTTLRSFLPGDDIAARAASLSYKIVGTRDKQTGKIIEELPDLPGYEAFQSSDGLASFFLSDDEIIVATPGSQDSRTGRGRTWRWCAGR